MNDQAGCDVADGTHARHGGSWRRAMLGGGMAALSLAAVSLAWAQTPPLPKSPVAIVVVDVAYLHAVGSARFQWSCQPR